MPCKAYFLLLLVQSSIVHFSTCLPRIRLVDVISSGSRGKGGGVEVSGHWSQCWSVGLIGGLGGRICRYPLHDSLAKTDAGAGPNPATCNFRKAL